MPLLLLLIVAIAVFSVTIHYTDEGGVTRTGLDGLLIYLIPISTVSRCSAFSRFWWMPWGSSFSV